MVPGTTSQTPQSGPQPNVGAPTSAARPGEIIQPPAPNTPTFQIHTGSPGCRRRRSRPRRRHPSLTGRSIRTPTGRRRDSARMSLPAPAVRQGDTRARRLSPRAGSRIGDYLPTYLAKLAFVRAYLTRLPSSSRVLDAGCGEGVLVEEFAARLAIEGIDENYASPHVRQGSLLALPFAESSFDRALCLDVLEHLCVRGPAAAWPSSFAFSSAAAARVSVPNLAHLQSRVHFALLGRPIRTASPTKHPGDRPAHEYLDLFRRAGFELLTRRGIFPTVPVLTALVRRHPVRLAPVHRALTALVPVPGWCFLNLFVLRKP